MKKKKGIRWVTGDIYAVASIGHGEYMKVGEQVSSRIPKQMRELGQKTLSVIIAPAGVVSLTGSASTTF